MPSFEIRKLKINECINASLPQIIEVFVEYYGEENREDITNRFNSVEMIGYGNPTNASYIISKIKEKISNRLIDEIFDKINVPHESREEMKNNLFGTNNFSFNNLMPISKYISFKKCSKEEENYSYKLESVVTFLKNLYPTVTNENVESMMQNGALSDLDQVVKLYEEANRKYDEELQEISEYITENEKNKEDEKKYLFTNYIEYLKSFSDIIPAEEMLKVEEGLEKGFLNTYSLKVLDAYLGSSLHSISLVESFSEENEEFLQTGASWRKDSIKRDRVKFFQALGIDLGNNYEDYMVNEECQKRTPSKELIEKIKAAKKYYKEKALIELYNNTSEYLYNVERLQTRNLYLPYDDYNAKAYHNKNTFITPNLTLRDSELELVPILCFNNGISEEFMDKNLMHELNHVYELNYQGYIDGGYEFICGWDTVVQVGEESTEEVDLKAREEKRKYELFNEIINEIIAQQLAKRMHEKGIYIINNETNAKDFGGTGYQATMVLVVDFFNNFKNEILMSRRNGNIQIILDKVGQENFDKLNGLFYEFNENFGGMKIYKVYDDMQNGIESEELLKYNELKARSSEIVSQMIEYSNQMSL